MRILAALFAFYLPLLSACELDQLQFDNDFSGASTDKMIHSCQFDSNTGVLDIMLQPENTPINDSPWYAFKLSSNKEQLLTVNIRVKNGSNRYLPKISYDGKLWQALSHDFSKQKLSFQLQVGNTPIWLSGQELITNQDYSKWQNKLAQQANVEQYQIAQSVLAKPVMALEIKQNPKADKWLVVLGRMHPPELTGAMALFPFVETLMSEQGQSFRQQFNILLVANINPDGVGAGHWRHNENGIDLNRDWINFSQPEVIGVHNRLQQIVANGGKMAMAVDFHSTTKNVFYTMPSDYGVAHPEMVNLWLNKLQQQLGSQFKVNPEPGTSPGKGVFKQYFADQYKVHAITYEMDDQADRRMIKNVAKAAAGQLMTTLTDTYSN